MLSMYCPGWPCACRTGPEFARCAYTVPAGRVRVIPARSSPAAHILSRLAVCVSYRPGVRPLRMYCPRLAVCVSYRPGVRPLRIYCPGWPCACHTGPEFARCACIVPAGRVRVILARSSPAAHVLSTAGRVRVIPARSSPAAHVLSRLAVCVSYRPGVRPLRMYCPRLQVLPWS